MIKIARKMLDKYLYCANIYTLETNRKDKNEMKKVLAAKALAYDDRDNISADHAADADQGLDAAATTATYILS